MCIYLRDWCKKKLSHIFADKIKDVRSDKIMNYGEGRETVPGTISGPVTFGVLIQIFNHSAI